MFHSLIYKREKVMFKKLVLGSLAAIGISSAAVAGGLPVPVTAAPADDSGIYLGGSIGYLDSGWGNFKGYLPFIPFKAKVTKDAQFGYRAFLGYDINKFFAVEGGWTFWNGSSARARIVYFPNFYVATQAFDIVLKGKMPLTDDFNLYAKVGPAYLMSDVKTDRWVPANWGIRKDRNTFTVTFGAGIDYSITPNIIANAEWLHFVGEDKVGSFDYQPAANAYLVGIRYKFTDIF